MKWVEPQTLAYPPQRLTSSTHVRETQTMEADGEGVRWVELDGLVEMFEGADPSDPLFRDHRDDAKRAVAARIVGIEPQCLVCEAARFI